MKIAIFGGTGLLGSNLLKLYSKEHDVRSFSRSNSLNIDNNKNFVVDFDNLEVEIEKKFDTWKPDLIVNTIAIVNLQVCEDDYEKAYNINTVLAKKLAKVVLLYSSYYIHISTDHFFQDTKKLHTENDEVNLLNNYALTKFKAEQEVLNTNKNSLVIRTNIIGFRNNDKESFFEWLVNSLANKQKGFFYTNYYTSPIEVNQLGILLLECFSKKLQGIYNIGSCEVISKYDFAIKTAEKFNFDKTLINKTTLESDNSGIKRALTLGLDVNKIEKDLNIDMPNIESVLDKLYKIYRRTN